jgi:hypothetical protein
LPVRSSAIRRSVISAAFIHGRSWNGAVSEGISMYVSVPASNMPLLLPFQKYVTWPYFWVSEMASWVTPVAARSSPMVRSICGGVTR